MESEKWYFNELKSHINQPVEAKGYESFSKPARPQISI